MVTGAWKTLDSGLSLCLEELLELFLNILIFSLACEVDRPFLSPAELGTAMWLVLCKETVAEVTPGHSWQKFQEPV